jgi:hypothetical protein
VNDSESEKEKPASGARTMPNNLRIEIIREPRDRRKSAAHYFAVIVLCPLPPGVRTASDTSGARETTALVVQDARTKLDANFTPGDTIEFWGTRYTRVTKAMRAIS